MSKYTTGEVAKICNVTVRTVQYYDSREILIPSELTEGGRRLYSEDDLKKMKIICFLREIGLPINTISKMLNDEESTATIMLLLSEHEKELKVEYDEVSKKLDAVKELKNEIEQADNFTVNTIGDVARNMKNKDKRRRVIRNMLLAAIPLEVFEIGTAVLWATEGIWWPFAITTALEIAIAFLWMIPYYYKKISFICPTCHEVFKPKYWEMFWANHTPKTRKLTCPVCNKKHWCVETYDENSDKE